MLNMAKHVERNRVLDTVAQRTREVMSAITVMMHRPNSEERRETVPRRHRHHVISKNCAP